MTYFEDDNRFLDDEDFDDLMDEFDEDRYPIGFDETEDEDDGYWDDPSLGAIMKKTFGACRVDQSHPSAV